MDILIPESIKPLYEEEYNRILKYPNPKLRQISARVSSTDKSAKKTMETLMATMYTNHGVGLAAPQMGILKRIIVVDAEEGMPLQIANPEIIETHGLSSDLEGCLSLPGLYAWVERPTEIVVRGFNKQNQRKEWHLKGLTSKAVQHEIDHLDGILFTDKADPATFEWNLPHLPW